MTIEISTFEKLGEVELPTVRRVGVMVTGLDNEGKPVLVNGQPWLFNGEVNTPHYLDVDVGPGVMIANLQVSMFGHRFETIEAFVTTPGAAEGLHAEASIEPIEGTERGVVILNLPISMG